MQGYLILALFVYPSILYAQTAETIGQFVVVNGKVVVTHPGSPTVLPVKLRDAVLFQDRIETGKQSKAKVLFADDSILSLGENTRIEVTEHIFDPNKDRRSTVLQLMEGQVRALVGRFFSGSGSKFEIHTPTAIAASRGSYGIVWIEEVGGKIATGVLNIGGRWEVRNIDPHISGSVILEEGKFTQVLIGLPPLPSADAKPDLLMDLQVATEVKERPKEETPKDAELPGRDVSQEKLTPIVQVTTDVSPAPRPVTETTDIAKPPAPLIPPIENQPPPTTTPVNVEIRFPQGK